MKIEINVPDGKSGEWEIETFNVGDNELGEAINQIKFGRSVPKGVYKRLCRNKTTVMSNTPDEIRDFMPFVRNAKGSVLINGLGLGVLLKALLEKNNITDITVVEKSSDVIKLVADSYKDDRLTIINADCFEYKSPKGKRYNAVWHDIWDYICSDNIEEMIKLHRKYGRKSDLQMSWCRKECEKLRTQESNYYF